MKLDPYKKIFKRALVDNALSSAKEIVPYLIENIHPKSVVDVGCGSGAWLKVFEDFGVSDVLGIDNAYSDRKTFLISEKNFIPHNLLLPIKLNRQFDLVLSLEVAEHLPKERAKSFIDDLVQLGPVILFSAAIPLQTGIGHLNEQWPGYWADLFREKEYECIDCIRFKFWQNERVEWWYSQNTFLFIKKSVIKNYGNFSNGSAEIPKRPFNLVHPGLFYFLNPVSISFRLLAELVIKRLFEILFNFLK